MVKLNERKEAPVETPDEQDEAPVLSEANTEDAPKRRRNASALIEDFDFTDAVDKSFRAKGKPRSSKWGPALTRLYDATAEGKVPRSDDGSLQFIRVGNYQSRNGAQQQAKALKSGPAGDTYEFKVVGASDSTAGLYARVKELPADAPEQTPGA